MNGKKAWLWTLVAANRRRNDRIGSARDRGYPAKQPWPLVHIHVIDAGQRGIKDGDDIYVISPRGKVPFRAHVTEDIVRGTVEVNVGGGGVLGPSAWQAANANVLTDFYNRDPISGFPVYKALFVTSSSAGNSRRRLRPLVPGGTSLHIIGCE